jgi:hypothetical protein
VAQENKNNPQRPPKGIVGRKPEAEANELKNKDKRLHYSNVLQEVT